MEENKRLEVFVGDYIDFVLSTSIDIFKQESQQIQKNQTKKGESLEKVGVEENADKDEKREFTEEETADEEERLQFFKQIREAEYQKLMKTTEMQGSLEDKKTSARTDIEIQGIPSPETDIHHADTKAFETDSYSEVLQPVQTTREHEGSGQPSEPSLLRRIIQRITKVFRRKSRKVTDVTGARADIALTEYDVEIMEEIRQRKTRFGMLTKCFGR